MMGALSYRLLVKGGPAPHRRSGDSPRDILTNKKEGLAPFVEEVAHGAL